jgi:hypothetical protein
MNENSERREEQKNYLHIASHTLLLFAIYGTILSSLSERFHSWHLDLATQSLWMNQHLTLPLLSTPLRHSTID